MADLGPAIVPHLPQLRAYACALTRQIDDAEDLLQDTVCRALEKAHQFQPGTDLKRWLTVIMRNHWRSICRDKEVERRNDTLRALICGPGCSGGQEDYVLLGELPRVLTAFQLQAMLCEGQGWTNAEIAEHVGVSLGAVKGRIHYARKALAAAELAQ